MTDAEIIAALEGRYPQTKNARSILAAAAVCVDSELYSHRLYPHYPVTALLLYHSEELGRGWDEHLDQLTDLYSRADRANFIKAIEARYRGAGRFHTLAQWIERYKDQMNVAKDAWGPGFRPPRPPGATPVRDVWSLLRNPS